MFVHQSSCRCLFTNDVSGKRNLDISSSVAFECSAMMIEPKNFYAVRSEIPEVVICCFLCPGDIGDPQLAANWSGVQADRTQDFVDVFIARKMRDNGCTGTIPCHRDGGCHAV